MRGGVTGLASLLLAAVLAGAGSSAGPPVTLRLEQVIERLEQQRQRLRQVMRDEREATRTLSAIDASLIQVRRELAGLEADAARLGEEVAALQASIRVDVDSLEALKGRLRRRLQAVVRIGSLEGLRLVLQARSLHEMALQRALLARVAAADAALLREVDSAEADLIADRRKLAERRDLILANAIVARGAVTTLEQTRLERSEAILALGRERGVLELRVEALRVSQKQLQASLWRATEARREPVGLAVERGKLSWPAAGRIERSFGQAQGPSDAAFKTGWTLRAPLGTRVRAIAAGKVVHAGFLRGYGLLVIVDHGHGFHTLHAHLSRAAVKQGQEVAASDVLGFVGDSESLDGPKLYFELRRGGRPVNPAHWLKPVP